jgi:hypothetical protein
VGEDVAEPTMRGFLVDNDNGVERRTRALFSSANRILQLREEDHFPKKISLARGAALSMLPTSWAAIRTRSRHCFSSGVGLACHLCVPRNMRKSASTAMQRLKKGASFAYGPGVCSLAGS